MLQKVKPTTASRRQLIKLNNKSLNLSKKPLLKSKVIGKKNSSGRNHSGKITVFHKGGGVKRKYRKIDFDRKINSTAIVCTIEHDPNRNAYISSVFDFINKSFYYILTPQNPKTPKPRAELLAGKEKKYIRPKCGLLGKKYISGYIEREFKGSIEEGGSVPNFLFFIACSRPTHAALVGLRPGQIVHIWHLADLCHRCCSNEALLLAAHACIVLLVLGVLILPLGLLLAIEHGKALLELVKLHAELATNRHKAAKAVDVVLVLFVDLLVNLEGLVE